MFLLSTGAIHLQIKTTDKMVYDAVKDLLRRAPDRKGGAGRTEHPSESPSFISTIAPTPSQQLQQQHQQSSSQQQQQQAPPHTPIISPPPPPSLQTAGGTNNSLS